MAFFIGNRFALRYVTSPTLRFASLHFVLVLVVPYSYPRATPPPLLYAFAPFRFSRLALARFASKQYKYSTVSASLHRYYIYTAFFFRYI